MAAAGITATELAKAVGVSPSAVSQWKGNKTPRRETVEAIADRLDIDAAWLEFGAGKGPEPDLQAARERYLSDTGWVFRGVPADQAVELGSASIFVFDPTIEAFAREVGQNFADVVRGRASLTFRLIRLRGDDLRSFLAALRWNDALLPHLEASASIEQKFGRGLRAGLDRIASTDELLLMRIEERGTSGLDGQEFGMGSRFTALVRNTLDSVKEAGSGGAFGLGKAVLWRTSSVSTVLFNSDLAVPLKDGNAEGRLIGRTELSFHRLPEEGDFAGPGWFGMVGSNDDGNRRAESYWGNPALAKDLCLERPADNSGTSTLVVGFHDPAGEENPDPVGLADSLTKALAKHFFPLLDRGEVTMTVEVAEGPSDGDVVKTVRVEPELYEPEFVDALQKHAADDIAEKLEREGDVARRNVTLEVPARRDGSHGEIAHETIVLVRRAADSDPATKTHRTAFHRGTGMVIETRDMSGIRVGARPFHAVVLSGRAAGSDPTSLAAEEFLRLAEPPAHHRWERTPDLANLYQRGSGAALDRFRTAVVETIRELVGPASRDLSDGPRELKELLRITGKSEDNNRPRVTRASGHVDDDGSWNITATLTVKPNSQVAWKGRPVALFNGETGGGIRVDWEEVVPERNCRLDGDRLVIDAGKRQAQFRGRTRIDSHPVPAWEAAVSVDFRAVEKLDAVSV